MSMPRLATVKAGGRILFGAMASEGFIDLTGEFPEWTGLRDAAAGGGFARLAKAAEGRDPTHPAGSFEHQIPIGNPEKIICVGVNYPARNEEYKDGKEAPENMSLFVRFPRSFTGHGQPLVRPKASEKLDYEGEIAVVIGAGGRHIPDESALGHIAGLTLCNEGTIRDWVRHAKFNVTQGKNFEKSGSMGPWIVPCETPGQIEDVWIKTHVNGEMRQNDRTGRMLFPVSRQISYISTFTELAPGDIIVTGTPTGAGARLDPPQYLKPGDTVEVSAEGIGTLANGVMDEA